MVNEKKEMWEKKCQWRKKRKTGDDISERQKIINQDTNKQTKKV